jgi:hypothetical protein
MDKDEEALEAVLDDPFFDMTMWEYSLDIAVQICDLVREGQELKKVLSKPGYPSIKIVKGWMRQFPKFKDELELAKLSFADDVEEDFKKMLKEDVNKDDAPGRRIRMDGAKWVLERAKPEIYGPKKAAIDVNIATQILVDTGISRDPVTVTVEVQEDKDVLPAEMDEGDQDEC